MTYEEAADYILKIPKFTQKNDLSHTVRFLEELGNPQDNRKVIHVAGTNGKGSVCVYLERLLRSEGKHTGLFVSPHLIKMNERIVIDGMPVTDEEFLVAFEKTWNAVLRMQKMGIAHPTFFEFLFGMAMTAFAGANAEYLILETGLGGRLDATNAIKTPILTIITAIGMDHVEILGDTLEKIAAEKAGIIQPEIPVLYIEGVDESNRVIEKQAMYQHAFCRKISKSAYENLGIQNKHIAFSALDAYYEDTTWHLSNTGIYQVDNAMLALEAMRTIFGKEKHLETWEDALAHVKWEGRMEEILPEVYLDGAHNMNAVEGFVSSIPAEKKDNIILFSTVADKDYEDMIAYLCHGIEAEEYIVTTIQDKRAASADILGEIFRKNTDAKVTIRETIGEAVSYALAQKGSRTLYCLGSLYLVGTIRELIVAEQ